MLKEEEIKIIRTLYRNGDSIRKISRDRNHTESTVKKYVRDIYQESRVEKKLTEAEKMLGEGMSAKHVAEALNLNRRTIHKYFPDKHWSRKQIGQYAQFITRAEKKLGIRKNSSNEKVYLSRSFAEGPEWNQ